MEKNEIVLFETEDNKIKLDVPVSGETVWLTQDQMSKLFDTARSSVAYHINNMGGNYIRLWKNRRHIYFILLQRTIVFMMGIKE